MANKVYGAERDSVLRIARRRMRDLLVYLAAFAFAIPAALPQTPSRSSGASGPVSKADAKKAKAAYEQGNGDERRGDWEGAYTDYTDASNFAPATWSTRRSASLITWSAWIR